MYLMVKPNLKVDELMQDNTRLLLLLTDSRVWFYYLLTPHALIMGRSHSITTVYPGATLGHDQAQAG